MSKASYLASLGNTGRVNIFMRDSLFQRKNNVKTLNLCFIFPSESRQAWRWKKNWRQVMAHCPFPQCKGTDSMFLIIHWLSFVRTPAVSHLSWAPQLTQPALISNPAPTFSLLQNTRTDSTDSLTFAWIGRTFWKSPWLTARLSWPASPYGSFTF